MNNTELHTAFEWEAITGIRIHDPDGWRVDGKTMDAPIDKKEWDRRMMMSTCSLPAKYFIHEKD